MSRKRNNPVSLSREDRGILEGLIASGHAPARQLTHEAERNAYESSIDRRFTTEEARIKLKHLYPEIVEPANDPNPS